jgi:hypothetical protein
LTSGATTYVLVHGVVDASEDEAGVIGLARKRHVFFVLPFVDIDVKRRSRDGVRLRS